ncbi:hypothetical protein RFI_04280 [Reticulomyxa filosa]|uniref:RGS domain-containing protein n=1 Tax=Reticulomyxa filosa TaxID=46433 RepID=X6P3R6_RETFI|nr:hypothetical protein RFI_04280 [Reticulomyxa filosa]|eukprot:ETO32836.1 hypothetical protein RFI_04280 [Reticulomyxa filosa]
MGNCYPDRSTLFHSNDSPSTQQQHHSDQPAILNSATQLAAKKRKDELAERLRNPGLTVDKQKHDGSFESNSRNRPEFAQEAVKITNQFWLEHIQSLTDEKKAVKKKKFFLSKSDIFFCASVTLYGHLFCRLSDCRQIFLERGKVEDVSIELLQSIGQLLSIVSKKNISKIQMDLRKLGAVYCEFGITDKHYHLFLQALHWTFEESSGGRNVYSLRIKFCLEHIFTTSAKIITGKDFTSLFGDRVLDFWSLEFLDSLDICLAHPTGIFYFLLLKFADMGYNMTRREYFDRYLEQSFCVEYMSFLRKFNAFKGLSSHRERYEKALEIYRAHLSLSAQEYIELSNQDYVDQVGFFLKHELDNFAQYQSNGSENETDESPVYLIKSTLLDNVYNDVAKIIEKDIWPQFVAAIHSIKEATRPQVV